MMNIKYFKALLNNRAKSTIRRYQGEAEDLAAESLMADAERGIAMGKPLAVSWATWYPCKFRDTIEFAMHVRLEPGKFCSELVRMHIMFYLWRELGKKHVKRVACTGAYCDGEKTGVEIRVITNIKWEGKQ